MADSPHQVGQTSVSVSGNSLTISGSIAGLGNVPTATFDLTATVDVFSRYYNRGGNKPQRLGSVLLCTRGPFARVDDHGRTRRPAAEWGLAAPISRSVGAFQRRTSMPTYMDVHDIPGVKASDVAGAHEADVRVQGKYGVNYKHYWVDEANGKVFCLVDAPDPETATRVHREAHGLEAHTLYKVEQGA